MSSNAAIQKAMKELLQKFDVGPCVMGKVDPKQRRVTKAQLRRMYLKACESMFGKPLTKYQQTFLINVFENPTSPTFR